MWSRVCNISSFGNWRPLSKQLPIEKSNAEAPISSLTCLQFHAFVAFLTLSLLDLRRLETREVDIVIIIITRKHNNEQPDNNEELQSLWCLFLANNPRFAADKLTTQHDMSRIFIWTQRSVLADYCNLRLWCHNPACKPKDGAGQDTNSVHTFF